MAGFAEFAHPAQRLTYHEMLNTLRAVGERFDRLGTMPLGIVVPAWTMAPMVPAFQGSRGVGILTAATLVAEAGDIRRFKHPHQQMAFLGLVTSERSAGETRRHGAITKTDNTRVRKAQIEATWPYRHPAGVGAAHRLRQASCQRKSAPLPGRQRPVCACDIADL